MVWFYRLIQEKTSCPNAWLSIPLWSDFILHPLRYWYSSFLRFQSHYGLILSSNSWVDWNKAKEPFNPTMVWFYRKPDFVSREWGFFQSHYGLILSSLQHQWHFYQAWAFNPTMVWFYRNSLQASSDDFTGLSIPLWSDFITTFTQGYIGFRVGFQSHYGLILSATRSQNYHEQFILSIPLWSDFISSFTFRLQRAGTFQSHYGLILSSPDSPNGVSRYVLSIPLWSDFIFFNFLLHKKF